MSLPTRRPTITESTDWAVQRDIDPDLYDLTRWGKWSGLGVHIRNRQSWDRWDAYCILCGLDPTSDIESDNVHLIWIGERPVNWKSRSHAQVWKRLLWRFNILQKRLWGLNSPMPPRYWILCAIERGVPPPWLAVAYAFADRAKRSKKLKESNIGLHLPARIPRQNNKINRVKQSIRDDWERWVLSERGYNFESKEAFSSYVNDKHDYADSVQLLKWLSQWETETCVTYGALDPDGPTGRDGLPAKRGYNWLNDLTPLRILRASPKSDHDKENLRNSAPSEAEPQ